jgi:DNA-binding transcriptional regulator YiaG
MMPDTMTGAELRRLRERAKLTQEQLASRAEVHWRTILRWEAGQVSIPALAARGLRQILTEHRGTR